eukprot:13784243-Alexandrium_andersonii.AAC.1
MARCVRWYHPALDSWWRPRVVVARGASFGRASGQLRESGRRGGGWQRHPPLALAGNHLRAEARVLARR